MATRKTTTGTKAAAANKPAATKQPVAKIAADAAQETAPTRLTPKRAGTDSKKAAAGKPPAKKSTAVKTSAAASKSTAASGSTAATRSKVQETPAAAAGARKPAAKKPAPTPEATEQPAAPASRKAPAFSIGDKVVHPQHGAAIIVKKVKQTVAGNRQDYFQLEIATDQLTVFVPIASIEDTIRPVINKNQARKVFSLFKEPPQEAGSNWSRWYKVLNEKMTSGDIYQVAEVVRDLTYSQQTKGISPALKRMLSKARLTLTSELRFALNVDEEEATKKLDRALPRADTLDMS